MATPKNLSLISAWHSVFAKKSRDFNILSSIHLDENDHSDVLCEILKLKVHGQRIFLQYFVENILGISGFANTQKASASNVTFNDLVVKTQVAAIGPKKTGYIDLLIEDTKNGKVIIVENKICNAVDTQWQLQRYWCTYAQNPAPWNNPFLQEYNNFANKKSYSNNNVYVAYLTDDGSKTPTNNSVDPQLLTAWGNSNIYRTITIPDLLDWLQDCVLPNCTFCKSGMPISSILLYIDYLKSIAGYTDMYSSTQEKDIYQLLDLTSQSSKNCFTALYDTANNLEKDIANEAKKPNPSFDLAVASDLCNGLKQAAAHVYTAIDGWSVNCTPSYISFFPTEWKERFGGSVTSNIHFQLNNWQSAKPALYFCIHNNACKQYIYPMAKYDQTLANQLAQCVKGSAPANWNPQSGHFYWNLTLNMQYADVDEFFQNFAQWAQSIQLLRDFVESNCQ